MWMGGWTHRRAAHTTKLIVVSKNVGRTDVMRVVVDIISANAPRKAYDTARPKLSLSGTEVRRADEVTPNRTPRQFHFPQFYRSLAFN